MTSTFEGFSVNPQSNFLIFRFLFDRKQDGKSGSPERKKQPCTELHELLVRGLGDCAPQLSASKISLDSARNLLQIEYSPCPLRATQSLVALQQSLADTVAGSPTSPVQLDHKEIPLGPEEKELILSTPMGARGAAVRQEISKALSRPAGVSPLARRFAYLRLGGTTTESIPLPLCRTDPNLLQSISTWADKQTNIAASR
jgi:hypothetical protein